MRTRLCLCSSCKKKKKWKKEEEIKNISLPSFFLCVFISACSERVGRNIACYFIVHDFSSQMGGKSVCVPSLKSKKLKLSYIILSVLSILDVTLDNMLLYIGLKVMPLLYFFTLACGRFESSGLVRVRLNLFSKKPHC